MKKFIAGCVAVIVLFVALIGWHIHANYNEHTCIIEVTDKERVNYNKNGKYLIFGRTDSDTLVLENADSLLRGKFNSSDIYAELEVGKIYEFTVVGYRMPIFNAYENIIEYKEITSKNVGK